MTLHATKISCCYGFVQLLRVGRPDDSIMILEIIMGKMLCIREFDLANLRAFIFLVHLFLSSIHGGDDGFLYIIIGPPRYIEWGRIIKVGMEG